MAIFHLYQRKKFKAENLAQNERDIKYERFISLNSTKIANRMIGKTKNLIDLSMLYHYANVNFLFFLQL